VGVGVRVRVRARVRVVNPNLHPTEGDELGGLERLE